MEFELDDTAVAVVSVVAFDGVEFSAFDIKSSCCCCIRCAENKKKLLSIIL